MQENKKRSAFEALLSEYQKAIAELRHAIAGISAHELISIADSATEDNNCKSIQTILAHVVNSGYSYCIYIQSIRNTDNKRPEKVFHTSGEAFIKDLDTVFQYTKHSLADICDDEIEEPDEFKKIITAWGQKYDIEQMMEHAIVHILRHRRQVEKFILLLRSSNNQIPKSIFT